MEGSGLEDDDPSVRGSFDSLTYVGTQAVITVGLGPGTYTALVVDGIVYVARMHSVAWKLAGAKGVEEFYGFAEIDEAGKVVRLLR